VTQLELPLVEPPCPCCAGEREFEPFSSSMDMEPCVWCREADWMRWRADPYASLPDEPKPVYGDWYRRPSRTGQLGLGLGNEARAPEVGPPR
jgi:hypothetical protein